MVKVRQPKDVMKDIWAKAIPKSFVDNYNISRKAKFYGRHNTRSHGPSYISKRCSNVNWELEWANCSCDLFDGGCFHD